MITLLVSLLLFVTTIIEKNIKTETQHFVVYNTPYVSDYGIFFKNKRIYPNFTPNSFIPAGEKRILLLGENTLSNHQTENKLQVDVLILSNDRTFSIDNLSELFNIEMLVLDNSIAQTVKRRWISDCERLGIQVHDVSKNGAFVVKL